MKNDYLDYMRATEEWKTSDSLAHYRTKGSKNGVSTTPGYKAIGEKALGILNSAGRYVYNTAKTVGDRLSGVKNDYDLTKKRIINATMNGQKPSKNAVKVGNSVLSFNTTYKGKHVLPEVADKMKEVDAHEQRRTGYNNANVAKPFQNIAAEKARVAAAKQKEEDERHASALKKSLALAKSHDAELSPAQQKEAARIQDERHASALKKSLALAKEKETGDEAEYQKKAELDRKQEDMNSIVAKFKGQTEKKTNENAINVDAYAKSVKAENFINNDMNITRAAGGTQKKAEQAYEETIDKQIASGKRVDGAQIKKARQDYQDQVAKLVRETCKAMGYNVDYSSGVESALRGIADFKPDGSRYSPVEYYKMSINRLEEAKNQLINTYNRRNS